MTLDKRVSLPDGYKPVEANVCLCGCGAYKVLQRWLRRKKILKAREAKEHAHKECAPEKQGDRQAGRRGDKKGRQRERKRLKGGLGDDSKVFNVQARGM